MYLQEDLKFSQKFKSKKRTVCQNGGASLSLNDKNVDQLKNSWHDLLIADWMAGYFKSRHQVYVFSSLVLMGINLAKRQTPFLTLGRTRGGGGGNCQTL